MIFDAKQLAAGVAVADGGWSTQLRQRGLPNGMPAEAANVECPAKVRELVRDYLEAGARFITTNTFGANRFNLERSRLAERLEEINARGAELARETVNDAALVVGAVGPSGRILAVREIEEIELARCFEETTRALAAGGSHAIVLETFSELAEILLAVKVAHDATGLPVIASMSFDAGPQRTRTMMGAAAEECAAALDDAGADVIGFNCGAGIEHALPAVVALRGATRRALWVKPSAGVPDLEDGTAVWRQTPEDFASHVPPLLEAGANIVGGCCGTGPEHIRRVARVVARWRA